MRAVRTERVESHFERVMSTEELKDIAALRVRHAQRQQTERTTMKEEDEVSQRFSQQLERERSYMQVEDGRSREWERNHTQMLAKAVARCRKILNDKKPKASMADFEDLLLEQFESAMRQDRDFNNSAMPPRKESNGLL